MDYFLVMTYDYHGSWNSYTGNNSPLFARENQTDKTFCDVSLFNGICLLYNKMIAFLAYLFRLHVFCYSGNLYSTACRVFTGLDDELLR